MKWEFFLKNTILICEPEGTSRSSVLPAEIELNWKKGDV